MKTFTKLGSWIDSKLNRKSELTDPNNEFIKQAYQLIGGNTSLMPYEVKEYIRQGYMINPHVHTVINRIIKPASTVPFLLYELIEDKKKEYNRYKAAAQAQDYERAEFYASKSMKPVTNIPELTKMLEQPNEHQSFQEWSEQGMGFHLLTGEEIIYGLEPVGYPGMFTKLYNMPPQITVVEKGDWRQPIKGYYIEYFGFGGKDIISPDKICHIKYMNPDYTLDGQELRGLSPMTALCKVVKRSNDSGTAQMAIIQNGHPVGILTSAAERGVSKEAALELKKDFRKNSQGAINKGDVLLTTAQLQWLALGMNSVDMQLLDADKADLESIARVYQVPLPIVLNDASSYNNIKEAKKQVWQDARLPLITNRRDALNRWLLPKYALKSGKNLFIDFDLMAISDLKQDDKNVVDVIKTEIESGTLTPNEARYLRNREPSKDPNADRLYIGNLKPLEATNIQTPPPAK